MAKTFTATWLGDGSPEAQLVHEGGVRFIKGEKTTVPADLSFNGLAWADNIKGNPMFSCEDDPDVPPATDEEIAAMKQTLTDRGVKFRANISADKLREMVADTE